MYKTEIFKLGREALQYAVKTLKIKTINIPYYLCNVIRHALVEVNCKPKFYHINDNFMPAMEFDKDEFILYPNYFGICQKNVKLLSDMYPKLILDNAHAYYDEPCGIACFNAGHKFGENNSYLFLKTANYKLEETNSNKPEILKRKEDFLKLHNKYKTVNRLKINTSKIIAPFVYPCLCETTYEADMLVSDLKNQGKIIYRYWNLLPENYPEYKFYSRLVPIPLD